MGVLGRARVTLNDRFHHPACQPGPLEGTEPAPGHRRPPPPREPRAALRGRSPSPGPGRARGGASGRGEGPRPPSIVRLLARLRHCLKNPPPAAPSPQTPIGSAAPRHPAGGGGSTGGPVCAPRPEFRSGVRGGQPGRCEAARGGPFPRPRPL